jgi:hypothetical protein
LLAVQRLDVAQRTLIKLAAGGQRFFDSLNLEAFVRQGSRALTDERPAGARLSAVVRTLEAGAPLLASRAAALGEWCGSAAYRDVLAGRYPRRR